MAGPPPQPATAATGPEPFLGIEPEPPLPTARARTVDDVLGELPDMQQAELRLVLAGLRQRGVVPDVPLAETLARDMAGRARRGDFERVREAGLRRLGAPLVTIPMAAAGAIGAVAEQASRTEAGGGIGVIEKDPVTGEERVVEPEPLPGRPAPKAVGPTQQAFEATEEDIEARLGRETYDNIRSDVLDNIQGIMHILSGLLGLDATPAEVASPGFWSEQAGRARELGRTLGAGAIGGSAALLANPLDALRTRPVSTLLLLAPLLKGAKAALPPKLAAALERAATGGGRTGGVVGGVLGATVSPEMAAVGAFVGMAAENVVPWLLDRTGLVRTAGLSAAARRWLVDATAQEGASVQAVVDRIHDEPAAVAAEIRGLTAGLGREIRAGTMTAETTQVPVADIPGGVRGAEQVREARLRVERVRDPETEFPALDAEGGIDTPAEAARLGLVPVDPEAGLWRDAWSGRDLVLDAGDDPLPSLRRVRDEAGVGQGPTDVAELVRLYDRASGWVDPAPLRRAIDDRIHAIRANVAAFRRRAVPDASDLAERMEAAESPDAALAGVEAQWRRARIRGSRESIYVDPQSGATVRLRPEDASPPEVVETMRRAGPLAAEVHELRSLWREAPDTVQADVHRGAILDRLAEWERLRGELGDMGRRFRRSVSAEHLGFVIREMDAVVGRERVMADLVASPARPSGPLLSRGDMEMALEQRGGAGAQTTPEARLIRDRLDHEEGAAQALGVASDVLRADERAGLAAAELGRGFARRETVPGITEPRLRELAGRLADRIRETYKEDQLIRKVNRGVLRGLQRGTEAAELSPDRALAVITDIVDADALGALRSRKFRQEVLKTLQREHPGVWRHTTPKGLDERLRVMGEEVMGDIRSSTIPFLPGDAGVRPVFRIRTPGLDERAFDLARQLEDAGLPPERVAARVAERTGIEPQDIAAAVEALQAITPPKGAPITVSRALGAEVSLGDATRATAARLLADRPGRLREMQAEAMIRLGSQVATDAQLARAQKMMTAEYERFSHVGRKPAEWLRSLVDRVVGDGEAPPQLLSVRTAKEIAEDLREGSREHAIRVADRRGDVSPEAIDRAEREVLALSDRMRRDYRPPDSDLMRTALPRYVVLDPEQVAGGGPRLVTHATDAPAVTAVARGFNETFGWRYRMLREMEDVRAGLRWMVRGIKGNLTSGNPTTHVNNFLANTALQSVRRGVPPLAVWQGLKDSHGLWTRFKAGELAGRELELMQAVERSGMLDSSILDAEMGGAGADGLLAAIGDRFPAARPATAVAAWPWNVLERGYSWGDGIYKLDETLRQVAKLDGRLDALRPGQWMSLAMPRERRIYVGRKEGGSLGVSDSRPPLDAEGALRHPWQASADMDALIVKSASKPGLDLFFDYNDIPLYLQALRSSGGATSIASAFLTWGWKSLDIPGLKRGLIHRLVVPETFETNAPMLRAALAVDMAGLATRRALLGGAIRSSLLEADEEALRAAFRFSPRQASVVMLQAATDPDHLASRELGSVNSLTTTDTLFRLGVAAFVDAAVALDPEARWLWDPGKPDSDEDRQFLQGYPEEKAAEVLLRRKLVRDRLAGEVAGPEDAFQVIGLAGSPWTDVVWQMMQDDAQRRERPDGWHWNRFGALLVGGLTHKVLDVAWGGYREWQDGASKGLAAKADLLTTWKRKIPDDPVSAAYASGEEWIGFTRHLVRRLTGLGWDVRDVAEQGDVYFDRRRTAIKQALTTDLKARIASLEGQAAGLGQMEAEGRADLAAMRREREDEAARLRQIVDIVASGRDVRLHGGGIVRTNLVDEVVDEERSRWHDVADRIGPELLLRSVRERSGKED